MTTPETATVTGVKKKFRAKGHDAQLQDAQFGNKRVTITKMSTGETLEGMISKRDKFTITIRTDRGNTVIVYKHAIETIEIA